MNIATGMKRWFALSFFALAMAMPFGCKRDHNPLLATPAAGATQLTVTYLNWDLSQAPQITMFFDVSTNLGPVTDLLLGNIAILVDSKPEIPLSLVQDPLIPGRYTFTYRSRSTNSTSAGGTWHGLYVSYGDLPVTYINP
jgi:hypothetical protein